MRSNTWRALFLLSLTLILVSAAMDAQAARRSSLAGNQFINDPDDMFAFPQLTHQYKNRVIFDLGQDSESSSGSVVFGDNLVWNFNTGRGMYQNTTSWVWSGTDRNPEGLGFSNPDYEWWDVGLAFHLGDTPIGVKFNWQKDNDKETPPGATEPTTDEQTSLFGFQLGATFGSVEAAAELGFGGFTDNTLTVAPTDANDFSMFLLTLLLRGDIEDFGGVDWRWIAAFTTASGDPKAENIPSYSTSGFRASIGPVWGTPKEWEVAAYLSFETMSDKMPSEDPFTGDLLGDNKEDSLSETVFPSYNMAMEYYLNSWFAIRGGVTARSGAISVEYMVAASDEVGKDDERFYNIDWTLGLGVDKGNWGLDLALEEENVHTGYVLFNGGQDYAGLDHPIALITAWLAW